MTDRSAFSVRSYKVTSQRIQQRYAGVEAVVEVRVGIDHVRRSASGTGPLHALDNALRACLEPHYPELRQVRLTDYEVHVVDADRGTAAQVRVVIEASDEWGRWDSGCVSENVVDASFEALSSAMLIGLMRARSRPPSARASA